MIYRFALLMFACVLSAQNRASAAADVYGSLLGIVPGPVTRLTYTVGSLTVRPLLEEDITPGFAASALAADARGTVEWFGAASTAAEIRGSLRGIPEGRGVVLAIATSSPPDPQILAYIFLSPSVIYYNSLDLRIRLFNGHGADDAQPVLAVLVSSAGHTPEWGDTAIILQNYLRMIELAPFVGHDPHPIRWFYAQFQVGFPEGCAKFTTADETGGSGGAGAPLTGIIYDGGIGSGGSIAGDASGPVSASSVAESTTTYGGGIDGHGGSIAGYSSSPPTSAPTSS
jgi:hypothetical protein